MDDIALNLLDYVCKSISYGSDDGEWWRFPAETLAKHTGDCDDSAILLCSLLRNFYPPDRVYAVAGTYRGLGHMWAELDGEILEATYTYAHAVTDPQNYHGLVKFNDVYVIELFPKATAQLFQLARNECLKLTLMTEAMGNEMPPECPSLRPPFIVGLVLGGILGIGFPMILLKGKGTGRIRC